LGQWIASAQQQGLEDKLPLFAPYQLDDCGWLANRLAEVLPLEPEQKQSLLVQADPHQRMASVVELLTQA
jgi:Lon protease-like protein